MKDMKLRIGSEYNGNSETGEFYDATVDEAIRALRGEHGKDRRGNETSDDYHEGEVVYLVKVWPEETTVEGDGRRTRTVTYKKGEPRFGQKVEIYGVRPAYDTMKGCQVNWSAHGSVDPDEAAEYAEMIAYAAGLASAANAKLCPKCIEQQAERDAKWAALKEGV